MEISEEVNLFLRVNEAGYRELLNQVTQACLDVKQEMGGTIVRSVYGRDDKQATGAFKSPEKIAKALAVERENRPIVSPSVVQDIIGVTIVVHYPDEMLPVLECLKSKIKNAKIVKDTQVTRNGYHAHHIVFQSRRVKTSGLHCEVQIKTMLHDSWGAKTHDLNYKPRGHMDDRLSRMMQVFGDALQSIEVQSELLRDLIHERWSTDIGPRRAVREHLFNYIPSWRKSKEFSPSAVALLEEMVSQAGKIAAAAPDDSWLSDIVEKINECGETSPREATWLSIQLAMIRETAEFISFANGKATDLATRADQMLSQGISDKGEIETLPLAVSAYGDSVKAIELSRYLLDHSGELRDNETLRFNLANFLVEQAIDGPMPSDAECQRLRSEVGSLIAECDSLRKNDPSSFVDFDGMLILATSNDPVAVRKAIDLLQQGRDQALAPDRAYADACYELNARLGWRKLLEIEGRVRRPVSTR